MPIRRTASLHSRGWHGSFAMDETSMKRLGDSRQLLGATGGGSHKGMTPCLRAIAGPGRDPTLLFHIIYVSVNVLAIGQRERTRAAVRDIRHVFLEADHDGVGVLATLAGRKDLPRASYVLHSS